MSDPSNRSDRLRRAIADLLAQVPEIEAAAVVSFDGLPMASALPITMDEDRVAAMSAALLSLGERAADGLGRGSLSQVYIEGQYGTVFLVSADDEAVLVAVAAGGAKVGMMLYEVRRAAAVVAEALRHDAAEQPQPTPIADWAPEPAGNVPVPESSVTAPLADALSPHAPDTTQTYLPEPAPTYAPVASEPTWPSYLDSQTPLPTADPQAWS